MTHDSAKDDFKFAGQELKDAASATADGIKKTAHAAGEEIKEVVDGEDR